MYTKEIIELITAIVALVGAVVILVNDKKKGKNSKKMKINASKEHNISNNQNNSNGNINLISSQVHINTHSDEKRTHKTQNAVNSEQDTIKLANAYTSIFAEENKLKTERITITKQEHTYVEGTVELDEVDDQGNKKRIFSYTLTGVFANKVLTAEYKSEGHKSDERGAINLKLIDPNILSGFCSFSKLTSSDDEIRVSPYVWVSGENVNLLNGTYDFCTKCYEEGVVCCCASEKVDMPLFLDSETNGIRSKINRRNEKKENYSIKLPQPFNNTSIRQIVRDEIKCDGKVESGCHFFDINKKQCRIYDGRPIDCRLFPFDIKLSNNKNEYIVGYYPDLCERQLPDYNTMVKYAHILRPYFFLLYPYLHIFTDEGVCQRLKTAEFKAIATFQDFIF